MTTMIVWFLVLASDGYREASTITSMGPFPDLANCQHVSKQINSPGRAVVERTCVQARVVVPK